MKINNQSKIGIIGLGNVGKTFLQNALQKNLANSYYLLDLNQDLAYGNQLDSEDTWAFAQKNLIIKVANYQDLAEVDLLVITASSDIKRGKSRLAAVNQNAKVMKNIAAEVKTSGFNGITLIASNPVDLMTQVFQKETKFPTNKVIGSGTLLDSMRLAQAWGQELKIAPCDINIYMLGEHGDSMVPAYSLATIGQQKLKYFLAKNNITNKQVELLTDQVRFKGKAIVKRKNLTEFGIASALCQLAEAILTNANRIFPCSVWVDHQEDSRLNKLYFSFPAIINQTGVKEVISLPLKNEELERLVKSATILKEIYQQLINEAII